MKVLIVDDSRILRERLISMIGGSSAVSEITEAASYKQGLMHIISYDYDVYILDIKLRDGSGVELLKRLSEKQKAGKVIMFTNYPYKQFESVCMNLGAAHFLSKSTDFSRIEEILNNYELQKAV